VVAERGPARWWQARLVLSEARVRYRFLLQAGNRVWWYNALGLSAAEPMDRSDFQVLTDHQPVPWLADSVFYQVFPDRFCRASKRETGAAAGVSLEPWAGPAPAGVSDSRVFYGGDLDGIGSRLDYLQGLGVNALYLNPIFSAPSNHRYDVADYANVDPLLGGNDALIRLRQATERHGMRIMLDVVPNHCGAEHAWFRAACQDPAAPEADFFSFNSHPDDYACWLGVRSLPKLNYASPELRRRIYEAEGSVMRRWLQPPFSADGWRIDVANMLGRRGRLQLGAEVARGLRQAVKSTRPEAYLLGENFFDASSQLQGDEWDGVMNYAGFSRPLWYWLAGFRESAWGLETEVVAPGPLDTAAMAWALLERLAAIPWVVALQQYNLLGSHDTPRIQSRLGGDEALHRVAVTLLFTFPGVPAIYYGDELSMIDEPGLGPRACMRWNVRPEEQPMYRAYRELVGLRRRCGALQRGGFQILDVGGETLGFQRETSDERILVGVARSAAGGPLNARRGGVPDGARFRELFSGEERTVAGGQLPNAFPPERGASVWEQLG
jgi:alpha-glucosidase